jgi:hypothetical protein
MMKQFFLLTSLACALVGNVKAGPQVIIQSTHAEEDARAYVAAVANELQTYESFYHRIANAEHPSKVGQLYAEWLNRRNAQPEPTKLLEGDQLPQISQVYDDEATIRTYLHDSGYNDLSAKQIADIRVYMKANHIRHVSQLGR